MLSCNIFLDLAAVSFVLLLTTGVCLFFLKCAGQEEWVFLLEKKDLVNYYCK